MKRLDLKGASWDAMIAFAGIEMRRSQYFIGRADHETNEHKIP